MSGVSRFSKHEATVKGLKDISEIKKASSELKQLESQVLIHLRFDTLNIANSASFLLEGYPVPSKEHCEDIQIVLRQLTPCGPW